MNSSVIKGLIIIPVIGVFLYVAYPKPACGCLPAYDYLKMQFSLDNEPIDTDIPTLNRKFLELHPIGTIKNDLYITKAGGYIYNNCVEDSADHTISCEYISGYPFWSDRGFIQPAGIRLHIGFDQDDKLTTVNFGKF